MVVQESKQVCLAAGDLRAMQRVTGPDLVRTGGLEPADHLRRRRHRGLQLEAFEVALQRALRRRPATLRPKDPGYLCRCATQVLLLDRRSEVENLGRVRGGTLAGCGTSAANPPVRHHRHHRSIVLRATRIFSPNGPSCSRSANARTIGPRWRVDSAGSITSWISS